MSESLVAATSTPVPVQAIESNPSIEVTTGPAHFDVPEVLVTVKASAFNRRMILAGGACVMAIVAVIALPGSSRDITSPSTDSVGRVRNAPATLRTQESVVVTPIEEQVVVRPVAQARLTTTATVPSAAIASSQPAAAAEAPGPAEPSHATVPTIDEPTTASPHVVVKAAPVEQAPATPAVTITGCLEKRNDTFRLIDTDGDAPKSRSWKSGFLAKRPADIELVDAASNLWLAAQVGQRVSATGTLDDRELHVRSVRRATGACN